MVSLDPAHRLGIAGVECFKKVLRLFLVLLQAGTGGQFPVAVHFRVPFNTLSWLRLATAVNPGFFTS